MINLSMTQALELWDELVACHYSCNNYGGDVAEIYAYRLTKNHDPSKGAGADYSNDVEDQIATSLEYIYADGSGDNVPPFNHRAHVRIVRD
jgi:hypothetical protein